MRYELIFTEAYNKRATKFLKKHPRIIETYRKTLKLLELNPHHPSLRLHQLQGKLNKLHSVSMNMQYRVTFEFIIRDKKILLIIPIANDF